MTNNLWELSLALVAKWYPSCLIRKFLGSIHYGWWGSVMLGIISFHLEEKNFMCTCMLTILKLMLEINYLSTYSQVNDGISPA